MTSGHCLCTSVSFSLKVRPRFFYRCHCSLCRLQTGVGHNLATLVRAEDFQWDQGRELIRSWQKPSGYRNDFCGQCGSTVPNPLRESPYVWIPLGLLDTPLEMSCIGDFCSADAMPWDEHRSAHSFDAATPSLEFLLDRLQVNQGAIALEQQDAD